MTWFHANERTGDTYFHTCPIVSHKDSLCHRGKSKLGIGLFIHELAQGAFDFSTYPHILTQSTHTQNTVFTFKKTWFTGMANIRAALNVSLLVSLHIKVSKTWTSISYESREEYYPSAKYTVQYDIFYLSLMTVYWVSHYFFYKDKLLIIQPKYNNSKSHYHYHPHLQ